MLALCSQWIGFVVTFACIHITLTEEWQAKLIYELKCLVPFLNNHN